MIYPHNIKKQQLEKFTEFSPNKSRESNKKILYIVYILLIILLLISIILKYNGKNSEFKISIYILVAASILVGIISLYTFLFQIDITYEEFQQILQYSFKSRFIYNKEKIEDSNNLLDIIYQPLYLQINNQYIYYINNDYDHICRLLDKNGYNTEKYYASTYDNIIVLLKNKQYRSKSIEQQYITTTTLIPSTKITLKNINKSDIDINKYRSKSIEQQYITTTTLIPSTKITLENINKSNDDVNKLNQIDLNIDNTPIKEHNKIYIDKFLIEIQVDNITYYRLLNLQEYNDIKEIFYNYK